jgi:hypothetical protein
MFAVRDGMHGKPFPLGCNVTLAVDVGLACQYSVRPVLPCVSLVLCRALSTGLAVRFVFAVCFRLMGRAVCLCRAHDL